MSSYQKLVTFGSTLTNALPVYSNDPVTYCVGSNCSQGFNHGGNAAIYGQNSPECQTYMAQRCAGNWDGVCEYASRHVANEEYATRADTVSMGMKPMIDLTPGDVLVRNTAMEKYLVGMTGGNCELKTEQFDPINPSSPFISRYVGTGCVPQYAVDPSTIDSDPVMNKLLDNPRIAPQLLVNIKNTMRRNGTLASLIGTRLGSFYALEPPTDDVSAPLKEPYIDYALPISVAQVDGLGLPGSLDWNPYAAAYDYVDYWPYYYIAGSPYYPYGYYNYYGRRPRPPLRGGRGGRGRGRR